MIKSIFYKVAQCILIITLVYAGSFVLMEESSEKTEKTEKSEEALHSFQHSNAYRLSLNKKRKVAHKRFLQSINNEVDQQNYTSTSDFNVTFIYTTSFLDSNI